MLDRRFAVTVLAIVLVAAGATMIANREQEEPAPLHEQVAGTEQPVPEAASMEEGTTDYMYLLRAHEGHVAVFHAQDLAQPEMVLDTLVQYLPDYDQAQLEQGIPVTDYPELVALIEDFVS